jgi:hypothetical protein
LQTNEQWPCRIILQNARLPPFFWHMNRCQKRMAKKTKQPDSLQNAGGNAVAANRQPAPPLNALYFMQPRPTLPPKIAPPTRRRLEITIDPETHAQIVLPIKFIQRG